MNQPDPHHHPVPAAQDPGAPTAPPQAVQGVPPQQGIEPGAPVAASPGLVPNASLSPATDGPAPAAPGTAAGAVPPDHLSATQPVSATQPTAAEQHTVQPVAPAPTGEPAPERAAARLLPETPLIADAAPAPGSPHGEGPGESLAAVTRMVLSAMGQGASDVHIHAGVLPLARVNGALSHIPGQVAIGEADLVDAVRLMTASTPGKFEEFLRDGEADFSWTLSGVARFRLNVFRERGSTALALRVIPRHVPSLDQINMPAGIQQLADAERGLVLVTGATGAGKSTTLAAIIDHINHTYQRHILTIEDPIEMLHSSDRSLISQREVGTDTPDFHTALRRALRQDPDVILVGEIRDEETMHVALRAAETGHLVLSTLHTMSAAETITRILDLFPPEQERQARAMLAGALAGIVSQRLVRTVDGARVPAVEVLIHTGRVARCIEDPSMTGRLHDVMQEGGYYGMQTFDQALLALLVDERIDVDEAIRHANTPQNFRLMMEAAGLGPDGKLTEQAAAARERESRLARGEDATTAPATPPPLPGAPPAGPAPGSAPDMPLAG